MLGAPNAHAGALSSASPAAAVTHKLLHYHLFSLFVQLLPVLYALFPHWTPGIKPTSGGVT